jgi:RNA polymerase sigma-70 factor (ECF subfamily)
MESYNRLLWAIVGGILKDVGTIQDMEECVCDVYLDLWKNPRAFDPEKGSLKTYLAVMAKSRALDKHRRLSKRETAELDENLPSREGDVADALIARELLAELNNAVAGLPEPDREIISRRYFMDEKPAVIAVKTGIAVTDVKNRLYQTKLKLRKILSDKE